MQFESPLSVPVCSQHSHTVMLRFPRFLRTKWRSPLLRLMNQSQLLEFAILLKHCQVVLVDSGGELAKVLYGIDLGHFVRWRLRFEGIPFVLLLGSLVLKS
jgi:hypothetical protein